MTEATVDPALVQTKPFATTLNELNKGRTHSELSSSLQDLVAAVMDTGKKGTLTLTIIVESAKSHDMVVISDKVVVKKPEARAATMLFVDQHYNLRRDNPEQPQLPLGIVPNPESAELKEVRNP